MVESVRQLLIAFDLNAFPFFQSAESKMLFRNPILIELTEITKVGENISEARCPRIPPDPSVPTRYCRL